MHRSSTNVTRRATSTRQGNCYLLATCYFRNGHEYRAYHTLKGCTLPQSRYLLALCSHKLGKLVEAEQALKPDRKAPDSEVGIPRRITHMRVC
eukprot:458704-Prorocentrum_minimum.AAC.4